MSVFLDSGSTVARKLHVPNVNILTNAFEVVRLVNRPGVRHTLVGLVAARSATSCGTLVGPTPLETLGRFTVDIPSSAWPA